MTVDEELSALMDRLVSAIGDVPEDTTVAGFAGSRRALAAAAFPNCTGFR